MVFVMLLSCATIIKILIIKCRNGAARANERKKLERLCRYISCSMRYQLKIPYRDGSTHVIFEPLDLLQDWRRWCPGPGVRPQQQTLRLGHPSETGRGQPGQDGG